jgi:hypothetical protein
LPYRIDRFLDFWCPSSIAMALLLYLSWVRPIQSNLPNPTSTRSSLMVSTNLCLGLPCSLFPSGFPIGNLYVFLFSTTHATCPAHLILDLILIIYSEEYKSCSP